MKTRDEVIGASPRRGLAAATPVARLLFPGVAERLGPRMRSTDCSRFTTACPQSNVGPNAHRQRYEKQTPVLGCRGPAIMVQRG